MLNGESSRAENISCAGRFGALSLFNAASAACSRRQCSGEDYHNTQAITTGTDYY